jgi:hypothetical protein
MKFRKEFVDNSGNTRLQHWFSLHPEKLSYEYARWIRDAVNALVKSERWDVVTCIGGGSIRDHDAFTKHLLTLDR